MEKSCYNIIIGRFNCTVVSDGYILVPEGTNGSSSEPNYEKMDISCLLVQVDGRNILVDTGCGSAFQDTSGKLQDNLKTLGISPESIDTIVYTHGHEDHAAGTVDAAGNLVFPNARYVVAKKEWDTWEARPETPLNEGLFASARKHLLKIKDRFDIVGDNFEVVPGLSLLPSRGHTLGGVVIRIADGTDSLLCIGDLIHSLTEFDHPERYSFLDADPAAAVRLRTEGVAEMAASTSLIFACHFPFPGIGRFITENGVNGWQPVPAV